MDLQSSLFVIADRPFCVWEVDLAQNNQSFIESIDGGYFAYLGRRLAAGLEGEDKQRAAVALRTSYSHALESFFSLLFASLQAPDCVPGWLLRYTTHDLRTLAARVRVGGFKAKTPIRERGWAGVASTVMAVAPDEAEVREHIAEHFAPMWARFADDFLDEHRSAEYNAIKHGCRYSAGGFGLRIRPESALGVPDFDAAPVHVGGSHFGCTYYESEAFDGTKNHFRLRRRSINWSPDNLLSGLEALSVSIQNVVIFLLARNGYVQEPKLLVPKSPDFYTRPWRRSVGVLSMTAEPIIERHHISVFTDDDILAAYPPGRVE